LQTGELQELTQLSLDLAYSKLQSSSSNPCA
jgi:hypothetical protein